MSKFWKHWRKIVVNHISKIHRRFDRIYNIIVLTRKEFTWMYSTRWGVLHTVAYWWCHKLRVASKWTNLLYCCSLGCINLVSTVPEPAFTFTGIISSLSFILTFITSAIIGSACCPCLQYDGRSCLYLQQLVFNT